MPSSSHRFERHGLLGTVTTAEIELHDSVDPSVAGPAIERAIIDELARGESVFSAYDDDSELCRWRRGEVDVSSRSFADVMAAALTWQERSHGAFNPLVGLVADRWAAAADRACVPDDAELADLADSIATPRHAVSGRRVERTGDCSRLTLNAIAKGSIADAAVRGARSAFDVPAITLNVGGDVVRVGDTPTLVGIENPLRPYDNEPPLLTVQVTGALATSGDARRGVRIGGRWFGHVLDPRTGHPANGPASATVVADTAETADVVATVCVVLDADQAIDWLATVPEAEALLVARDGSVATSPGFGDRAPIVSSA